MSGEREEGAGLVDVLDRVLDKGVVIDAHVRVAVIGVEILAVEARVVVASIQTYLTHADALAFTRPAARPHPPDSPLTLEPVRPDTHVPDALPPGEVAQGDEPLPPAGGTGPALPS